ncbi:MAG: hypothetical protein BMS9Abin13_038 [Patescibacteria group bacterium]|nr:MAG: hypothetical protein BMS9Abin13_038 [Patescibacteria group bacterium]
MERTRNVDIKNKRGITFIELLVVIAIIGIIASVVLPSLNSARDKAREAHAKAQLRNVRTAIASLEDDTGKWPNGCQPATVSNPEIALDASDAGIKQQPTVGDNGTGCIWTSEDIANWKGPYIETPVDPWGNSYWFDPDYYPYKNCATISDEPETVAVLSFGPNGAGINAYDCDDIFLKIQ